MADLDLPSDLFLNFSELCHNCTSLGNPTLNPSNLKRCSACKMLTYCNMQCQREHWYRHHKNMCKILCGEKTDGVMVHKKGRSPENCSICKLLKNQDISETRNPNSVLTSCQVSYLQSVCKSRLRDAFKIKKKNPIHINLPCRELSNQYLKPKLLDESLTNNFIFLEALREKYAVKVQDVQFAHENLTTWLVNLKFILWFFHIIGVIPVVADCLLTNDASSQVLNAQFINNLPVLHSKFQYDTITFPWWGACLKQLHDLKCRLNSLRVCGFNRETDKEEYPTLFKQKQLANKFLSNPAICQVPSKYGDNLISPVVVKNMQEGAKCGLCKKVLSSKPGQQVFMTLLPYVFRSKEKDKSGLKMDKVAEGLLLMEKHWAASSASQDILGFS